MLEILTKTSKNEQYKYVCEKCNYNSNKKDNYTKHLQTKKHNTYQYLPDTYKKEHVCNCGKIYKHKQSLNNHKNKCKNTDIVTIEMSNDNTEMSNGIIEMSNGDNIDKILDKYRDKQVVINNITHNYYDNKKINSNNNNGNGNGNTFSVQHYLDTTCKNAKTIDEMLANFKFDLLKLPEKPHDFMKSIADSAFAGMTIEEYPIRCSDTKRNVFYCKNAVSKWEKGCDLNRVFIKELVNIICKKRCQYVKQNPDWHDDDFTSEVLHFIIMNASKSYDREVISGMGNYVAEKTRIIKK